MGKLQINLELTQSMQRPHALQLARDGGIRVFDLVAFVQHAVVPPTALEPAVLCHERLVCCDTNVKRDGAIATGIFQSSAFGLLSMKLKPSKRRHPMRSFLLEVSD